VSEPVLCMPVKRSQPTVHTLSSSSHSASTTTSGSSTSTSTRSSSPDPVSHTPALSTSSNFLLSTLRRRRRSPQSPQQSKMFSTRKYTPLPTSSSPQRNRAGGSLATWKRWIILAMAVFVLIALGYTRYSPKTYGEDEVWDAESEFKGQELN